MLPATRLGKGGKETNTTTEDAEATTTTSAPSPTLFPGDPTSEVQSPPRPLTVESSSNPTELNKLPLPFLSIPLGVRNKPNSSKKTWAQKKAELLDQERRMQKRKIIVKEATRGYFHDFHAIRSHGGKTWRSPSTLIREDKALYFPDIQGTCLADRSTKHTSDMFQGKVSVVCILNSRISEEHTKSFYEETLKMYGDHPKFQMILINLQENSLKAYLLSLFLTSLRSQIPKKFHPTYLLSHQDLDMEREAMGLHNKHVGYTYLVDSGSKVRWAGCSFAERSEVEALVSCTGVLLNRFG
ncbi:hypothetical protein IE53DRAFT_412630 [Violaceomyces palustris]|uniref:Uncharacterized protein n=1 Tax=Violaceomyces palustris TaxID=1673888 RepID=A0ACD0NQE3_9BASI|nr:hypothetical protein IE53DRAFT_412630 [Violaceomyces palustris]